MNEAFLLTGGNLGNRMDNLQKAIQLIKQHCGPIVLHSSVYETAPWGFTDQPPFLNQALRIETELSPNALLKSLLTIESVLGRKREIKLGPRIIDIDILLFNDLILTSDKLTVPHPAMSKRRFVLMPLAEIASQKIHPVFKKSIQQLLEECEDELSVYKIPELN